MTIDIRSKNILIRRIKELARQISRNGDCDIDELFYTSNSDLFLKNHKTGKVDIHSIHTADSTLCEDDESIDLLEEDLRKISPLDSRGMEGTNEDDSSLKFEDFIPECQPEVNDYFDPFVGLNESFARLVSDTEVCSPRKEQRQNMVRAFKRKLTRVTFAENLTVVSDEHKEIETCEEYCSTWYNDEDYDACRREVRRTMEKMVWCHRRKKEFAETDHETARGLEQVTREMVLERKQYKLDSWLVVYDEQEKQRLSCTADLERIREVYVEATTKARETALEYGKKDEEAIRNLY